MNFKNLCLIVSTPLLISSVALAVPRDPCASRNKANPKCLLQMVTALENQVNQLSSQLSGVQTTPGPQGVTGATGPTGPKGDKGDQGPAGLPTLTTDNLTIKGNGTAASPLYAVGLGQNIITNTTEVAPPPNSYIGTVFLSAHRIIGGIPCDGRELDIATYQVLYILIGTSFGGDGITKFRVPDLRAQTPNGMVYYITYLGIFP